MSALLLDMFDRRFADLVELGRARIPNLAPAWTDHNYHDPGVMLVELLAWTAEAQMYALSRMRADERRAYAALLGIALRGPLPAAGLIWPRPDQRLAAVIEAGSAVGSSKPDAPPFWPAATILLVPARLQALATLLASGNRIDQSAANRRGGAGFEPFGADPDAGGRLELHFECGAGQHLFSGLDGVDPALAKSARMALGVRVAGSGLAPGQAVAGAPPVRWRATLADADAGRRWEVPVTGDSTAGMLRSGTLLLDLAGVPRMLRLQRFSIRLAAANGFVRPARIECIEANVLPVRQRGKAVQELHLASGLPGQVLQLEQSGLQFDADGAELVVEIVRDGRRQAWEAREDLEASGPADGHYLIDAGAGRLTFGNGVNGALPPPGAQILLSYAFSAGAAGNLPRSQRWTVPGAGEFGTNLDPMTGGDDASALDDLLRAARSAVREAHPLVSEHDLVGAALAAPGLDVARAEILGACAGEAQAGALTMVALRGRAPGPEAGPETARWLRALQRHLAARLPMGQRLRAVAPRYVRVAVTARLVAAPMEDPEQVRRQALDLLERRLAVVAERPGAPAWPLGEALSLRQVEAWLRKLPGVARVAECHVYGDKSSTPAAPQLLLPRAGLPLFDSAASSIVVERPGRPS